MKGKARRNGIDGYDITLVEEATLRDQFAMAAPISYQDAVVQCGWERAYRPGNDAERITVWNVMAFMRYEFADAMLKARVSKEGEDE